MSQSNQPGYPLPPGELGEDEIVCQLVYLPDRPEYWQAFLGALHYMTTWRAWERDDDKRGKDAAANWREAFELTIGCWRMTCLEQLQQDVSDILSHLRNTDPCCDQNITYYDSDTYITIIVPGFGDPPEFYGETEVEDWEEWREHLCYQANLWVDELIRAAQTIEVALDTGGLTVGLLAAAVGAIAFFVVGGVLALPLLMVVVFGLAANVSATIFADAAVDIEDARNDIVCALLTGRSVSDAVETALSSGIAWDTLFTFLDYDSATAILYEGGDGDTVFLDTEKDDSCECLCTHFSSQDEVNNPIIYQSATGAQFEMKSHASGPWDELLEGVFYFNRIGFGDYCGPWKMIDTVIVSDALDFTAFSISKTGEVLFSWGPSPDFACDWDLTLMEGHAGQSFFIKRNDTDAGGCTVGDITITITYHDI